MSKNTAAVIALPFFKGLNLISSYNTLISFTDGVAQTLNFDFTKGDYVYIRLHDAANTLSKYSGFFKLTKVANEQHVLSISTGGNIAIKFINHSTGQLAFTDINIGLDVEVIELFAVATSSLNQQSYSFAAYRGDNAFISIGTGSPSWTTVRFGINEPNYTSTNIIHASGDVIIPQTGRVFVESKWWNNGASDERVMLRHKNSAGTTIRDYGNMLNVTANTGYGAVIINATAGDRLNWVGHGASGAVSIYWSQDHTELRVTSLPDNRGGSIGQALNYSTVEQMTNRLGLTGKPIYVKTFTGTTPNNSSDNIIFSVTGSTKIIGYEGMVTQSAGVRYTDVKAIQSGNFAHGPAFQFYGTVDAHWYNATGDGRWQNTPYEITVEYEK